MLRRQITTTRGTILCGLFAAAVLLLSAGAAQASGVVGEADTLEPKQARDRLDQATALLRDKKATGEQLTSALELLSEAHGRVGGTAREVSAFRRKAQAKLLKALALFHADRRTPHKNKRGEVNALAAQLLGKTAGVLSAKEARFLSGKIRKVITKIADDRKPNEWQQEPLDAAYAALARLNDPSALQWMIDEHHHTKEREIPFLMAAHTALLKFRDVPGKVRFDICDTFITAYSATELVAQRVGNSSNDQAAKRFWDRMKVHVVPLLQHYAGKPRNEEGQALSTLREFSTWWRQNDDARKAPWKKRIAAK